MTLKFNVQTKGYKIWRIDLMIKNNIFSKQNMSVRWKEIKL